MHSQLQPNIVRVPFLWAKWIRQWSKPLL